VGRNLLENRNGFIRKLRFEEWGCSGSRVLTAVGLVTFHVNVSNTCK